MKITLRHPALVRGRVKRMTKDRLVLCLPEIDIEIPEVSSQEAPEALVVARHGQNIAYRLYDGKLMLPVKGDLDVAALARIRQEDAFGDWHPIFGQMITDIRNLIGHQMAADATRPERLYSVLAARRQAPETAERAIADTSALVMTDEVIADLEAAAAKARAATSEIVIIDGKGWRTAPEPCYRVMAESGHVTVEDSEFYLPDIKKQGYTYEWSELSFRYFSAGDIDQALAYSAERRGSPLEQQDRESITVLDPGGLHLDFKSLEMYRFAHVVIEKIEEHVGRSAVRDPGFIGNMSSEILVSACRLRDAATSRSIHDPADDELASAMTEFTETLRRNPAFVKGMKFEDLHVMEAVMTDWNDRDIVMDLKGLAVR